MPRTPPMELMRSIGFTSIGLPSVGTPTTTTMPRRPSSGTSDEMASADGAVAMAAAAPPSFSLISFLS